MNETTAEWVFKAENDFDMAHLAMSGKDTPILDGVCFHSQQCAEKYLKAFLQEHGTHIPRTHFFAPLLELCLQFDSDFETLRRDLDDMEGYGTAMRYPGVKVVLEMAENALATTTCVRSFVREKLGLTN